MTGPKAKLSGDELRDVQQASYLLHLMSERQHAHYAACAAEAGLTAVQVKLLMSLQAGEAIPMRALAERTGSDPSNLTGVVDKLQQRNALRRLPDPGDRRVKNLALTEEGIRLREVFWHRLTTDAGPIAALTPQQTRDLITLLETALNSPPPSDF